MCRACNVAVTNGVAARCKCQKLEPPGPDDGKPVEWLTCVLCKLESHRYCYPDECPDSFVCETCVKRPSKDAARGFYVCRVCHLVTHSEERMRAHVRMHVTERRTGSTAKETEERFFIRVKPARTALCPFCPHHTPVINVLARHINSTHANLKKTTAAIWAGTQTPVQTPAKTKTTTHIRLDLDESDESETHKRRRHREADPVATATDTTTPVVQVSAPAGTPPEDEPAAKRVRFAPLPPPRRSQVAPSDQAQAQAPPPHHWQDMFKITRIFDFTFGNIRFRASSDQPDQLFVCVMSADGTRSVARLKMSEQHAVAMGGAFVTAASELKALRKDAGARRPTDD